MIEVGEYVRTSKGEIFKVAEVVPTLGKETAIVKKENGQPRRIDLQKEKHSKNIIDLLEVGDYVNGNEVLDKYLFNGEKPVLVTTGDETNAKCVCEGDIRTILTKELYKANCYTAERKE